jgi:hypothetical protein
MQVESQEERASGDPGIFYIIRFREIVACCRLRQSHRITRFERTPKRALASTSSHESQLDGSRTTV